MQNAEMNGGGDKSQEKLREGRVAQVESNRRFTKNTQTSKLYNEHACRERRPVAGYCIWTRAGWLSHWKRLVVLLMDQLVMYWDQDVAGRALVVVLLVVVLVAGCI